MSRKTLETLTTLKCNQALMNDLTLLDLGRKKPDLPISGRRNTVLYVVTSLIVFYGGLTVTLRLFVWNSIRLYRWTNSHGRAHRTAISPEMNST
ncbi:unnamed protein product [Rotaria socialis]|uniref:Uncharacterized protein n=1 Tax=Rotaria socialis TaxID=392032 RepID=A0A820YAX8_9BILA|nr:unnamed protein product [Rotaria socialis]